jgi:hypothetical protein
MRETEKMLAPWHEPEGCRQCDRARTFEMIDRLRAELAGRAKMPQAHPSPANVRLDHPSHPPPRVASPS